MELARADSGLGHGSSPGSPGAARWAGGGSVAERTRRGSNPAAPYTPQPVKGRPLGCLLEIAETLVLTIVIFLVIQTFVAQPYRVQQESMRATLEPDEYVLVDKITPRFDDYSRGDIVVFNPVTRDDSCSEPPAEQEDDEPPFIKRVIGQPGDRVEIREGNVFVNDTLLTEPYVLGGETENNGVEEAWTVPADRLFVMGDNRRNSTDSRTFGPICQADVVGRAWLRYWPVNTIGILSTPTYEVPAAFESPNPTPLLP
jgi:signal peptidase I